MKKTIRDFDIKGKRLLIRCDFNVPIKDGKITDDNRIVESLKTINYAIDKGAKVILFSHLGKVKTEEDKISKSLKLVAKRLSELLNKSILFVPETRGTILEEQICDMQEGDVLLFENTRFEDIEGKKESSNCEELGKYWASLGDIFINDAFGTSHRAHASNVGVASNIPSGIGFLVEKELKELDLLKNPEHPYYVILGGAKINDKIDIVSSLVEKADKILIGGGMAFTFLKALNYNIGKSILDEDSIEFAKNVLKEYEQKIVLPIDVKATTLFADDESGIIVAVNELNNDDIGLDIGPKTIELFKEILSDAKFVFWNGTLGYSEFSNYATGTKEILDNVATLNACVILGGGDTVAASSQFGYKDKVTYASTGGGATLEYIGGKSLPAIDVIDEI